ncbi:unnamed protein product, partial [Rotaria sordida]
MVSRNALDLQQKNDFNQKSKKLGLFHCELKDK